MRIVIVGAGGTFWSSLNLIRNSISELRSYLDMSPIVEVYDPEHFEDTNVLRQATGESTYMKAEAAFDAITGLEVLFPVYGKAHGVRFTADTYNADIRDEEPLVVWEFTDSNRARADILTWCKRRPGSTLIMFTGCRAENGQATPAYVNCWQHGAGRSTITPEDREPEIYVHGIEKVVAACDIQTAYANHLTGITFYNAWFDLAERADLKDNRWKVTGFPWIHYWGHHKTDSYPRFWSQALLPATEGGS